MSVPSVSQLRITDLHVSIEADGVRKPILKGVDLTINQGEIHAVMGPNGSGKSTLAYTIAGHPRYQVDSGSIELDGEDVLSMSVDERARAGLFLAMQYPVEIPGVTVANFLRTAKTAIDGEAPAIRTWGPTLKKAMTDLKMDPSFAARNVNEGFSGGEKKRHEIVQLELLKPRFAVLDETDTGLGILLITHYTRILRYIKPDYVHVFVDGKVAEEGGAELADRLESEGYDRYLTSTA
jgi:Fe-S cluster assembly ATP-binding protein